MVIDTRGLAPGRELRYDVCIVGGGAAGITLARALRSDHRSIGLLESGGFEFDNRTQALYRGRTEATGLNPDRYLTSSRLRFFGGTTNHWAGMCRHLDPLDFAVRPWVPHSGWPIGLDDLAPFYARAAEILQFRPFDESWGNITRPDSLVPPGGALIGRTFRYSPPTRFGRLYRDDIVEAKTIDLLLHANVVHIDVNEGGTAVERLQVATLDGKRLTVHAPLVVLATGAVENARLLLLSNSVHKTGLGNGSDCVGRFFMEHPERTAAYTAITSRVVFEDIRALRRSRAMLCLSDDAQRTHELLNANIDLGAMATLRESGAGGVPLAIRDTLTRMDALDGSETADEDPGRSRAYTRCFIRAESAPRRESRVTLEDRETDALGLRRSKLTFVMDTLESRTFIRTMEIVARELGARQGGRVLLRIAQDAINVPLAGPLWGGVGGGNHHMGTTRMSDAPAEGVVDRHCQVHGVSNLYMAGSSVFATGGMANPTFTIVALALRLADHLATRLGRS